MQIFHTFISVDDVNLPNLPGNLPITASLAFLLTLGAELIRHAITAGESLHKKKSFFSLSLCLKSLLGKAVSNNMMESVWSTLIGQDG